MFRPFKKFQANAVLDKGAFLTFLVLHGDTEGRAVAQRTTHSRRRAVDHKATELGRLLPEVDGEGAGCVHESLVGDRKTRL